ncbi:MAG TPA: hypothetical protein VN776_09585 [Terracidiphilus sp.]|nr:hypothetical protein [Terracidiphilus sp.]
MKWTLRILRVALMAALALVQIAFAAVQLQQLLLRWRAERLMADMHQIRLYQSNWADAQQLMNRWGAWGHYDGTCTAKDCRYAIRLTDESERAFHFLKPETLDWLIRHKAYSLYRWLGGRYSIIYFAFVVQDGTIWRTNVYVNVQVPPNLLAPEDEGYLLIVGATSQQALRDTEGGGHVRGADDDLAQHPYYKAGRPGGCENCMMVGITYSTHTPQAEIERLTSFDMSCLTRLFSCKLPEDFLPAAKDWHIYHDDEEYAIHQQSKSLPPKACDIPLWALARDSGTVLVVDGGSTSQTDDYDSSNKEATVRVVTYLKGTSRWPVGSTLKVRTFGGELNLPPFELAEHLQAGKRYVILPVEGFYGTPELYGPANDATNEPEIGLPRCGLQEDTPEVRRELEKGFAENDTLRGPELR